MSLTFEQKLKMDVVSKEIETNSIISMEFKEELKKLREKRLKICYTCLFWNGPYNIPLTPYNTTLYGKCNYLPTKIEYDCQCCRHLFRVDYKCINCDKVIKHPVWQHPCCSKANGPEFLMDSTMCETGIEIEIKKTKPKKSVSKKPVKKKKASKKKAEEKPAPAKKDTKPKPKPKKKSKATKPKKDKK